MGRPGRHGVAEVNLTSLLDVLFCILFIVMLTSAQSEKNLERETEQEINQLQNQVNQYKNQIRSYDLYGNEAIVITLSNIVEEGTHQLLISEKETTESILLGVNRTAGTKERLRRIIAEKMETGRNRPIYIVFYCERGNIYTEEYNAIRETLMELQEENKEIFYRDMEGRE